MKAPSKLVGRWLMRSFTRVAQKTARAARKKVLQVAKQRVKQLVQERVKQSAVESALRGGGRFVAGSVLGVRGIRRYRLYLPPGAREGTREGALLPLLVMLHGCDQDAASFAAVTRMNRVAEREHFAVLYPEQDRLSNPLGCWHWFDLDSGRAQAEADSILQAIDHVCALHPLNTSAVALAGLSAGASLAALLAVAHPARFCAVAMHSGVPPGAAHSAAGALRAMRGKGRSVQLPPIAAAALASASTAASVAQSGPVWPPLLVLHGSRDSVVAPSNGRDTALRWAQACEAVAQPARREQRGNRYAACVTDFKRGARTLVTLVEIEGLGHAWSGGPARQRYADANGPDASRRVWRFVAQQLGPALARSGGLVRQQP